MTERMYFPNVSLRCDFCSSPDVRWSYPAEDYMVKMPDEIPFDWGSEGGFASCEPCHALIEKDDRDGLLDRSVETFQLMYGAALKNDVDLLREHIGKVHEGFWQSRKGAARAFG